MKTFYDAGIVGGGVIGLMSAYFLSKAGRKVAIFEKGKVGCGASSAAAGMLGAHTETEKADAFFRFAEESGALYPALAAELLEETGIDIQLVYNGMLKLAMTAEEAVSLKDRAVKEPDIEWLSRESVLKKERNLTEYLQGGLFIAKDGQVSPSALCRALARAVQINGGTIFEGAAAGRMRAEPSHFEISAAGETHFCEALVITGGTWSGPLFEELGISAPVHPVKGECLSVMPDGFRLASTVFHDSCYLVPKSDGSIVIGATMEEGSWRAEPTIQGMASLMEKAVSIMPCMKKSVFQKAWAGLRPAARDAKPYIFKHEGMKNLYAATGHYRNGILLAPKTGEMVRDLILSRQVKPEYARAFGLNRGTEVKS
ncbi:glycine oxidase ThiO [Metabacillus indicus]|uniref:glycine oxidase ThiO n=1 Tax=Metabacillus indicus TaxID=246786 RepID=UPI002A060101|nr:glycine oxidase ThiO [Metabacillus indicus]MDX8289628.1 glycine oxidase ThiO [Metabacillus indicus]